MADSTLRNDDTGEPGASAGAPGRGRPPRGRWLRILQRVLVGTTVLAVLGGAVVAVRVLDSAGETSARDQGFTVPELDVSPGASAPPGSPAAPAAADGNRQLRQWTQRVSESTDIPRRAVHAYVRAEAVLRERAPSCRLSWVTLAGIARVESNHGYYGGVRINRDGTLTEPIIGPPLDGSPGVKKIRDTDDGELDGDRRWDRAVGPLQFLPGTWQRWGSRAAGDGAPPNPQNVDDAALSAGRYLCSRGRDLSTAEGWWRAVLTYNQSVRYGQKVFSGADAYARASTTAS